MKTKLIALFLVAFFSIEPLLAKTFKTERWQTANGTEVVFYETHDVPMLELSLAFRAGSAYDGKRFGLSALTTHLIDQGTGALSATEIAERFANVGAQFQADSSRDMAVLQLKTLSNDKALDAAIDNFALIASKPLFRQDAFYNAKNQQLSGIAQMQESPNDVANLVFFNKLYQQHPYAHAVSGSMETVKALQRNHVRDFYTRYFVGSNAVLVLVGNIDSNKAHLLAEKITHDIPKGQASPPIPKALPLVNNESIGINFPSTQTILRIGHLGIDHKDANYFPLMVGNYILGGGSLVSRLAHEVREKRGLTYGVDSELMPMPGDGPFMISLSTANKTASTALKVTEETLTKFLVTGPSEEELTAAKQYLTGSYPLSLASNSNIAAMLLRMAFYHLPDNYLDTYTAHIAKVSVAEVKQAFENQIHPDKMLRVSVGANQQTTI